MALIPKFIRFPFGSTGDKTAVPDDVQPGGSVSYAEGWGFDYERNPATDPAAKRIPRNESNQLAFDTTSNIQQYQLYGVPWFYTQDNNGGTPIAYARGARVRYADAGIENVYISLVNNNTVPPTDPTAWLLETPLQFASLAETIAATIADKVVSPKTLAPAVQGGSWSYAVASGTANALIASLTPALEAYTPGLVLHILTSATNTGTATITINDLPPVAIKRLGGAALQSGDLPANTPVALVYDGTSFQVAAIPASLRGGQSWSEPGTYPWIVPDGVYWINARIWGAGGGGGGSSTAGNPSAGSAGAGGGYAEGWVPVAPGQLLPITVGAGGAGGGMQGGTGGTTSVGTLMSATGGDYGQAGVNGIFTGAVALGGVGIGGTVNEFGTYGSYGFPLNSSSAIGGIGGGTFAGASNGGLSSGAGAPGNHPGGGGCGGANNGNGGAGAPGLAIISY